MTTDLAEFLRAQYRERRAREEGVRRSVPSVFDGHEVEITGGHGEATVTVDGHPYPTEKYFETATGPGADPAVLADLDAKLALLDDLLAERHHVNDGDCWYTCPAATEQRDGGETCDDNRRGGPCDCGRDARVERRLRILAQPFTGHPEYPKEDG